MFMHLYFVLTYSIYVCKHLVDLDSSRKETSLNWWTYLPNGLEVFSNDTLADLIKGAPEINEKFRDILLIWYKICVC